VPGFDPIPRLEIVPKPEGPSIEICAYHWRRAGKRRRSFRVVLGEGFCRRCYRGVNVLPAEMKGAGQEIEDPADREAARVYLVEKSRRRWRAQARQREKSRLNAAPRRPEPLRKRASGRRLRGTGGLNAHFSGGHLSRKRFCLVGPRWSLTDLEWLRCDDRSHWHLSRAGLYDLEKHRAIVWLAIRVGETFVPKDQPTVDERHEGGIVRICKIFPFRGASVALGEYLAHAVKEREDWALTMIAQIRGKRFSEPGALPM
jgi:hypothetical protein